MSGSISLVNPAADGAGTANAGSGAALSNGAQSLSVLTLSGQSLQHNGGSTITISPSSAQTLSSHGQVKIVGGQIQITSHGSAEIMSNLVNTGGLINATSITANGGSISIGL
jgi:hypothetical protein